MKKTFHWLTVVGVLFSVTIRPSIGQDGATNTVRIGTLNAGLPFTLPVLAMAQGGVALDRQNTWQQKGVYAGSLDVAAGDFVTSAAQSGWILKNCISLGGQVSSGTLLHLQRGTASVIVMVNELRPDTCRFAVGWSGTDLAGTAKNKNKDKEQ